jgi:hypothetical protein
MATVAAWLACFVDWLPFLAPGEMASVMVIAADRQQARVAMRYLRSLIVEHPTLAQLVTRETDESIELSCRVIVEVATASFRTTRGYSFAAVLADELAFWFDSETSANPASEILVALRAAMATMPNALLMVATTPYARRGSVYETWRRHWAKDGDPILVWRASTRRMNPLVPQSVIDEAMEADPASAAAEYLAEFRSDVAAFVEREVIDALVVPGRFELPPMSGITYSAFTDPSGGSSDSMTLAIAHRDHRSRRLVLDAVREVRPPFSPDDVVTEFAALLKSYQCHAVSGDRYGGEWPRERFREHGIRYNVAERFTSDIYRDVLPLLNSGVVELLDVQRLHAQFFGLERHTARSGRDLIRHPDGQHDDLANAAAGALTMIAAADTPAMWRREMFLVDGAPVPARAKVDLIFGTMALGQQGNVAVIFWAFTCVGIPLIILDLLIAPLAPPQLLFDRIKARLDDLGASHRARRGAPRLFAPSPLVAEGQRCGHDAEEIDALLKAGEDLALSAAAHISSGRVKIAPAAHGSSERYPLGGILDANPDDDDPLRLALLVGIAGTFDGLSLKSG